MKHAQIGAVFFGLWGLLHIVGGIAILAALSDGPAAGFAVYQNAQGDYSQAAGAILGMNSFGLALVGAVVLLIAATMNWRNSPLGAVLNLALAGGMDLALVLFLLIPGLVSLGEALIGFGLLGCAAIFTGAALVGKKSPHPTAVPAQSA
jgi:hypothetical protein